MSAAQQLYDQGLRQFCKSQANRTILWYPEASRTLTKAIEADPGFLPAYRVRLKCHQALGRADEAAQEARAIEKLEGVSPPPRPDRLASQAFHDRGVSCMEPGGLIEDALYYLWKAPEFADAYDARSDVYNTLRMADEALADQKRYADLVVSQRKRSGGGQVPTVPAASAKAESRQAPPDAKSEGRLASFDFESVLRLGCGLLALLTFGGLGLLAYLFLPNGDGGATFLGLLLGGGGALSLLVAVIKVVKDLTARKPK